MREIPASNWVRESSAKAPSEEGGSGGLPLRVLLAEDTPISADMMQAIDAAEAKLQKQIRRFHARLKAHRDRTRISDSAPTAREQEEATYEQVVREMLDEEEE